MINKSEGSAEINEFLTQIEGKLPTDSKPITSLDNELVIDADVMPTPRPQTLASPTGNSTHYLK